MTTWVALFRGINVGGKHILPMKDLVTLLEKCGFANVKTYIQSGNVVFQSSKSKALQLEQRIGRAVSDAWGFRPRVIVLGIEELEHAAAANPFPEAERDPKTLHLFFLAEPPANPDLNSMDGIKADGEAFAIYGRVFYLHAPTGIARSRLAQRAEALIGTAATARNWRTVSKLLEIARTL